MRIYVTGRVLQVASTAAFVPGAYMSCYYASMAYVLSHTLALGRSPAAAVIQYHSFNAVVDEISIIFSALARAATMDTSWAERAFSAGANQLKLIESRLRFLPEDASTLTTLDAALDKLAVASPVIKQRTLLAAAEVVTADGQLLITEAELLRAIAAALDCPMPPLNLRGDPNLKDLA